MYMCIYLIYICKSLLEYNLCIIHCYNNVLCHFSYRICHNSINILRNSCVISLFKKNKFKIKGDLYFHINVV